MLSLFTVAVAERKMCLWSTNPLVSCVYILLDSLLSDKEGPHQRYPFSKEGL